MSSVAFLNEKTESFGNFEEQELSEETNFKFSSSDIPIPRPICLKKEVWLSEKIKKCCVIFNFKRDPVEDIEEKTECLEDLADFFRDNPAPMSRQIYKEIFDMFNYNLFRQMPQNTKKCFDPEEGSHQFDESWPHLKLVYDIFIRFLDMNKFRLDYSKTFVNERFMREMIILMNSEDPREKDMAKTAVHRIYARFRTSRAFLRKELTHILLKFIYETEYFGGIGEILQIYSCIINGLNLPLSEEFVVFLSKVLVPLHKVKNLSVFHNHLTICLVNFLHRDMDMFKIIIEGLVKYWPKTNSQKEVQFLSEIEKLLAVVNSSVFRQVQVQLFGQVAKCVLSPHFQVVERSLSMFDNLFVWILVEEHYRAILPIVVAALLQMRRGHWNQTVAVLVTDVLKKFKVIDPPFYDHVVNECKNPSAKLKRLKTYDEQEEEDISIKIEDNASDSVNITDESMDERGDSKDD